MEDVFKPNTPQQDIIVHLLNNNIRLEAEIRALKGIFSMLASKIDPAFDQKKVQPIQDAVVDSIAQKILASHPLYSDYWKKQMDGLKGLGVDFD